MEAHHTINFKISFHFICFAFFFFFFPSSSSRHSNHYVTACISCWTFWFISLERFFVNSTSVLINFLLMSFKDMHARQSQDTCRNKKIFQYWNFYRWCHRATQQLMRIDFINHHSLGHFQIIRRRQNKFI